MIHKFYEDIEKINLDVTSQVEDGKIFEVSFLVSPFILDQNQWKENKFWVICF